MKVAAALLPALALVVACAHHPAKEVSPPAMPSAATNPLWNSYDEKRAPELAKRAADWRDGGIVYQVFVDRFAPPADLEAKRSLYQAPRRLRKWDELPTKGPYNPEAHVWSHEIDFWGGDLQSLRGKLDYVQQLGATTVYLNPIVKSLTNHKYDAWDYMEVDPAYGTRSDVKALADDLHQRGMHLVLDGVFNHMGRWSPMFQDAQKNPSSKWRNFYNFTDKSPFGYVGWWDVENLPELNLENPEVQDFIYKRPDSVVQSYLRQEGIDGWRLDVAFDLGFQILADLTRCAHEARKDSLVVGEIYNYPEEWHPAADSVMNMHGRLLILRMLDGKIAPATASRMWETMVADAGMDHILKSWLVLDNHDTARLPHLLKAGWQQRMARVLQFTLPGTVCLYYGSELGMDGGEDPEQRAPMRWDMVQPGNEMLAFHKKLAGLRKAEPALRHGDYRMLQTDNLFAFARRTTSAHETVVVIANPTSHDTTEVLQLRESKLQDLTEMRDQLSQRHATVFAGTLEVAVPAHEVLILKPDVAPTKKGYCRYDRLP